MLNRALHTVTQRPINGYAQFETVHGYSGLFDFVGDIFGGLFGGGDDNKQQNQQQTTTQQEQQMKDLQLMNEINSIKERSSTNTGLLIVGGIGLLGLVAALMSKKG